MKDAPGSVAEKRNNAHEQLVVASGEGEVVHRFDPVWYSELAGEIKARDAANAAMNEEPE